jgi:hypothetical protein
MDEYGVEETVNVIEPAPLEKYNAKNVFVPPLLAKWLRPHQREGVAFMYQSVMGLKDYQGNGCILADDMGTYKDTKQCRTCRFQKPYLTNDSSKIQVWEKHFSPSR